MLFLKAILLVSPFASVAPVASAIQGGSVGNALITAAAQAPGMFVLTIVVYLFLKTMRDAKNESEIRYADLSESSTAALKDNADAMTKMAVVLDRVDRHRQEGG